MRRTPAHAEAFGRFPDREATHGRDPVYRHGFLRPTESDAVRSALQIAAALDIPERTVASRLATAKTRLRRLLEDGSRGGGQVGMGTLAEDSVPTD